MTTLRLLADLLCIVPRIAWAWVKTKLPHSPERLHCRDCGWCLSWDAASLICPSCQEQRRQATAQPPLTKLFCCDVDLDYQRSIYSAGADHYQSTRVYRCSTCSRIWLYIYDWYADSGSEADWHPQRTAVEVYADAMPPLFDERTRTKVY